MIPEYIIAIDLGTTKVVSIVGEKSQNGQYRIIAYSEAVSHGIRRGQVEQIQNVTQSVIPTLNAIKADTGIDIKEVYVGIAGQYITCIENKVEVIRDKYEEMISADEINELETKAGKLHLGPNNEILHIIPQYYSIDDKTGIIDPIGRLGNRLAGHFYVIAGNKSTRTHTTVCMDKLNLSLQQLILEPIASARATLSLEEKEAGVAMIDIGGGTTDLIIYKEHILQHTVVIPFGGNTITEDIKTECSVLYNQAEAIKIEYGLLANRDAFVTVAGISGHAPHKIPLNLISQIISSRVDEIIDMVLSEIYKMQCGKLGAGLVITGGVSKMKGIKQYLENKLKIETKRNPEITKKMSIEVTIGNPKYIYDSDEKIIQPKYATAVGLIMCGFDYLEANIQLQKKKEEEERKKREEAERKKREEEEKKRLEEEERKRKEREEEEQKRREAELQKKPWMRLKKQLNEVSSGIADFFSSQQEDKSDL
jgi:cell division protein FtsA